ncbi:hypothetical protein ACA910_021428 [Epithemia clementina (nom. ined.)]
MPIRLLLLPIVLLLVQVYHSTDSSTDCNDLNRQSFFAEAASSSPSSSIASRVAISVGRGFDTKLSQWVNYNYHHHQQQHSHPLKKTRRRQSSLLTSFEEKEENQRLDVLCSTTSTTSTSAGSTKAIAFPAATTTTTSSSSTRSTNFLGTDISHDDGNDAASATISCLSERGGAEAAKKTMSARQMEAFHLLSGGLAGTVASTVTNPLEVIKTQLQSSNNMFIGGGGATNRVAAVAREILRLDGLPGFFRGLPATLVGIVPSRSVYFYAYQRSKNALDPYLPQGSPLNALLSGFLAGIAGNTITNPIWMVRTRMQLLADSAAGQVAYSNYWDAIVTIFRNEGMSGFYKGVAASYWGCTEGAAQFLMYEQLKKRLLIRANRRRQQHGLQPTDHLCEVSLFLSAAASKMVASIATYPHEVARTRLREQAKLGVFKYKGMWNTLAIIAREEGRQSLYSGMGVHLLKVVPNSALMFLTYELVRKWLGEIQVVD